MDGSLELSPLLAGVGIDDEQSITMSRLVEEYSGDVGRQTILSQLPMRVNGLKLVQQRILAEALSENRVVKAGKLVAGAMELHLAGDSPIYEAAARMGQPHHNHHAYLDPDGSKVGYYFNPIPAGMRYVKLGPSAYALALFHQGIESSTVVTVKGIVADDDKEKSEPVYLIPSLPTALVTGTMAVGWGFGSETIHRNVSSVIKLAIEYVKFRNEDGRVHRFPTEKYAELLLPDYPIENILVNRDELIERYRQGEWDAPIVLDGVVELSEGTICVYTLGYGGENIEKSVVATLRAEHKEETPIGKMMDADVRENDDKSGNATGMHYQISLKRGVDVFEAWERIKGLISFRKTIHPRPNFTDRAGSLYQDTPRSSLEVWYLARRDLLTATRNRRIQKALELRRYWDAVGKIADHTDEVLDIVRTNDEENVQPVLQKRFDLSPTQAQIITSTQILKLAKNSPEKILVEKDKAEKALKEAHDSALSVNALMIDTLKDMNKKFGKGRTTLLPDYIGYVAVGSHGVVQFREVSEIRKVMDNFPKEEIGVHFYDTDNLLFVNGDGKLFKGDHPSQYMMGDVFSLPKGDDLWTVNFTEKGTACCVEGVVAGRRSAGYVYTTKTSFAVTRDGVVSVINVPKTISVRKTIGLGATTDIVHIYPYQKKLPHHYLMTLNDDDPNRIAIHKVVLSDKGSAKITVNPAGEMQALHHYTGKDWIFGVPSKFISRIATRAFHIPDVEALLDGDTVVRINLAAKKGKAMTGIIPL